MRPTPRRRKRLLACVLVCVALVVAGSVAPAFGGSKVSPARLYGVAQQALRLAKRAHANSNHALAYAKKAGPTGPQGPRGSEGLDGPQGSAGDSGPRGATGPAGPAGTPGTAGQNGQNGQDGKDGSDGAPGPTGQQGPRGFVRAFGSVSPDVPAVVAGRSVGLTGVSRPADDHYCLSVDDAIDVEATSPVVAVDLGLSGGAAGSLFAAVDSTGGACGSGEISVVTSGPSANAVAFTIVVP